MLGISFTVNESEDGETCAEYEGIGDSITIYLLDIFNFAKRTGARGEVLDGVLCQLIEDTFHHEYIHMAIAECVDTSADQEHMVMGWIKSFLIEDAFYI